jgi:methanogenic corrinoid protein MtbC1
MEASPWNSPDAGSQRADLAPSGWGGQPAEWPDAAPRRLERLIALDIVPRLVREQRVEQKLEAEKAFVPGRDVIDDFARIVLTGHGQEIREFMERVRGQGSSLQTLYLDLLTPTARRLGEMWDEDLVQFTEVTLGLTRLQSILRVYSEDFQNAAPHTDIARQAVVASMPGEQHNFGLSMVGEFLARAGWSIAGGPGIATEDLIRLVRAHSFAIIGFSVSCEARLEVLRRSIRGVRDASRNREIRIMVGGKVFFDHPDYVTEVGGDTTAPDALQATIEAESLLSRLRGAT